MYNPWGFDATPSLVEAACGTMNLGIVVYGDEGEVAYLDASYDGSKTYSGIKLEKGSSYQVDFTLYPSYSLVDGNIDVSYGDVEFEFSSADINAS